MSNIIDQLSTDMYSNLDVAQKNAEAIVELLKTYKELVNDIIKTKKEYISIVNKYSDVLHSPTIPPVFNGISITPRFSNKEMLTDTKQVQEMGNLIQDLMSQKRVLYSQLKQALETIASTSSGSMTTSNQIDVFLDQAIKLSSSNGTYGSSSLLTSIN